MAGFGDLFGSLGDLFGGLAGAASENGADGIVDATLGALFGGDADAGERPRSVQTDTYDRRLTGTRRVLNINDI